ncbi:hypothetical protein F5Y04DRAFT_256089 [Hypomontagnella monticulosa]|nr:hypothetical protein F5Y04DRAFT_256089 [Hypomontagnella monticulosa]
MCTYYYLHYHHLAPCSRDVEYEVYYSFCPNSMISTSDTYHGEQQVYQQPCEALNYAPECFFAGNPDYSNPCAAGGCLVSQNCSTGCCRLEDLGGCWICCRCNRGGNTLRWCVIPMEKIPDALCYHVICYNCRSDHH